MNNPTKMIVGLFMAAGAAYAGMEIIRSAVPLKSDNPVPTVGCDFDRTTREILLVDGNGKRHEVDQSLVTGNKNGCVVGTSDPKPYQWMKGPGTYQ